MAGTEAPGAEAGAAADEREAFEAWFKQRANRAHVERCGDTYFGDWAACAWEGWQARAAVTRPAEEPKPTAEQVLTDERIDHIADLVIKAMPDGLQGFTRSWGWRQFGRALLQDCAGYYADPEPAAAQTLTDERRDSIREEHIAWTGDFYRCEPPELAAFVRDIERACAAAWGVRLEGGAA